MTESRDPLALVPLAARSGTSESLITVLVAFAANLLIAVAKSAAAVLTGSASLVAEAAHSWADTGNEIFLLIANRRSRRPPDRAHPFGHGREAYVWSLFAALGLFVAGAAVSVTHGIHRARPPGAGRAFRHRVHRAGRVLRPGGGLVPAIGPAGQSRGQPVQRDLIEHVLATSDPTLRAVFAEDSAALTGLVIAVAGLGRPPADRLGHAGRRRVDRGRRAARRRRDRPDQPQPAVPGRPGGRPPGAIRPPSGPCSRCRRSPGSPTCGWRSSARG